MEQGISSHFLNFIWKTSYYLHTKFHIVWILEKTQFSFFFTRSHGLFILFNLNLVLWKHLQEQWERTFTSTNVNLKLKWSQRIWKQLAEAVSYASNKLSRQQIVFIQIVGILYRYLRLKGGNVTRPVVKRLMKDKNNRRTVG